MPKEPFDIDVALERVARAVRDLPPAAMFALKERGYGSLFQQLVGCILSIRTRDEVSLPTALRVLSRAPDAAALARMREEELDALISPCTFHQAKARQLMEMARRCVRELGGAPPADFSVLTSFAGVGPKCANLALGIAAGQARISVDIHVHRVTNRWGYVHTRSPDQTLAALEAKLPPRHAVELNRLLVPFGKHICTGALPWCSRCPVISMCRQIGVAKAR